MMMGNMMMVMMLVGKNDCHSVRIKAHHRSKVRVLWLNGSICYMTLP